MLPSYDITVLENSGDALILLEMNDDQSDCKTLFFSEYSTVSPSAEAASVPEPRLRKLRQT